MTRKIVRKTVVLLRNAMLDWLPK